MKNVIFTTMLLLLLGIAGVAQNATPTIAPASTSGIIGYGESADGTWSVQYSGTCHTTGSSYSTCQTFLPLPSGWPWNDSAYSFSCTLLNGTGFPTLLWASKYNSANILIQISNGSSNGAQVSYAGEVDCIFRHN